MRRLLGVLLASIVIAAACGSSGTTKIAKPKAATPNTGVQDTSLGPGVTATSIKLGVLMIDFNCVAKYVDSLRPDAQKYFQIFVDDVNHKGGIKGRMINAVYKTYCPLNNTSELAACTSLTEDEHVFAVVGTFYDPSGDAQLCFAKQHHTIIIADSLTQALIDRAPPGYMLTPDITSERRLRVILSLMKDKHTLDGKKIAVLSDSDVQPRVRKVVVPALAQLPVTRGHDAVLSIIGADTTQALSQLDGFIERWKTDGTNALLLIGADVSSKQFVERIKHALPDVQLVADTTSVNEGGRDEQKAHVSPNPYTGIITAEGQTGLEHTKTPHFAFCRDIWQKATGLKVPSPNVVIKLPNGKQNDIYSEVEEGCLYTNFFTTIATRVGPYLNNANWVHAVDTFGAVDDTSTIYASLHQGKYDADDTFGLVVWDPTIGEDGDWNHATPPQNVSGA